MKKYNIRYLKRVAIYCFGIGISICCLFLVVSLFTKVTKENLWASIYPLLVSFIIWCIFAIRIVWTNNLLHIQNKLLNVTFNDNGAYKISHNSLVYVSDNWLIASGTLVLHKDFIKSISVKPENKHNNMGGYYCVIKCKNEKKYKLFLPSTSECQTIKRWYKQGVEK